MSRFLMLKCVFRPVVTKGIAAAVTVAAVATGALVGCTETAPSPDRGQAAAVAPAPVPPPLLDEPIGVQLTRREPRLAGVPFRVLLDFEHARDEAFLLRTAGAAPMYPQPEPSRRPPPWFRDEPTPTAIEVGTPHTGRASLVLRRGMPNVAVKLSSLLSEPFPGKWTLAGAYFFSERPASVTVSVVQQARPGDVLASRTVVLSPKQWTPVLLDLTQVSGGAGRSTGGGQPNLLSTASDAPLLTFAANSAAPTVVFCDDVMLVDNDLSLAEEGAAVAGAGVPSPWTVRQRGLETLVERPNRFRLQLKTPDATAEGWTCRQANPLRACFLSPTGKVWTLFPDGRSIQDRQMDVLFKSADPAVRQALAAQHARPAEVEVAEEFGRVVRESPNDALNTGYDAAFGVYLIAAGQKTRLELKITPRTPQVISPSFEVTGLAKGTPVIVVEGQLVDRWCWAGEGRLLFELPHAVTKATIVNVSIK